MDIFDSPDRMLYIGESSHTSALPASSSRACPSVSQTTSTISHTRLISTFALHHAHSNADILLFNKPARPRYPLSVRHASAVPPFPFPLSTLSGKFFLRPSSNATAQSLLPEPIVFSKPARPRRLVPIPRRKSNVSPLPYIYILTWLTYTYTTANHTRGYMSSC